MAPHKKERLVESIKDQYATIAQQQDGCGCGCGCGDPTTKEEFAKGIGYSDEELQATPEDANLALGCGNPTAIAGLRGGETVLDLGSGGGFDSFLAATKVGPEGSVIGIDMTPEMIEKATENVAVAGVTNVEFRLGKIEDLPVEDNSIDVIISNCVINLSVDKAQVFQEAHRVLKPGGRLQISDVALRMDLPEKIQAQVRKHGFPGDCMMTAITLEEYRATLEKSGFSEIRITDNTTESLTRSVSEDPRAQSLLAGLDDSVDVSDYYASINIYALK